jgi:hypothetical protein
MGQSRGWLTSRNSITARRALRAFSERVWTTMPSDTRVLQAMAGLGIFSTSTRQMRQLPATLSPGW